MPRQSGPSHVVVDGSNIATEGRSMPSLAQLSEAVASFMEEYPDAAITVVVDATFGHRIDKKEVKEFEEGIANNELVAPPAGAVGRGDAFVLGIADKAGATVLSNDSFQEFHGEYDWLFDEGRLVGGKPVPHVGWVWVDRVPVRGPVSRKATRKTSSSRSSSSSSSASSSGRRSGSGSGTRSRSGSGSGSKGGRRSSKAASEPMPVPKEPPPGARSSTPTAERSGDGSSSRGAPKSNESVNELLPFLEFVEHHPVGTSVNGTVDAYSSHGAYITIGDSGVRGYVPLRLMADPPPRSAKKVMKLGESVTVVVVAFAPARRSIDCALPDMARSLPTDATADGVDAATEVGTVPKKPARKRPARKKSAAKKTAAKKSAAKKSATKKSAAETTASKKAAAKKTTARKTTAKRAAAKKTTARKTPAKTTTARKTPAKKTTAKKSAATSTATERAPAKKRAARKSTAKKTAARKPATTTAAPTSDTSDS